MSMGILVKIFIGFWVVWLLWYLTGGPLRDDKSKPFIGPDANGSLQKFGTSTAPY